MSFPKTTVMINHRAKTAMAHVEDGKFGPLPIGSDNATVLAINQILNHAERGNSVIITIRQVSDDVLGALEKCRKS